MALHYRLSEGGLLGLPKELYKTAKSKTTNFTTRHKLARYLTNDIGPEGIVGADNYNTHYRTINNLIKEGKQEEAIKYGKRQKEKVLKE